MNPPLPKRCARQISIPGLSQGLKTQLCTHHFCSDEAHAQHASPPDIFNDKTVALIDLITPLSLVLPQLLPF